MWHAYSSSSSISILDITRLSMNATSSNVTALVIRMTNSIITSIVVISTLSHMQDTAIFVNGSKILWKITIETKKQQILSDTSRISMRLYTLNDAVSLELGKVRDPLTKHVFNKVTDERFAKFDIIDIWSWNIGVFSPGDFYIKSITIKNTNIAKDVFVYQCVWCPITSQKKVINKRECSRLENIPSSNYMYKDQGTNKCIKCNCDAKENKCDQITGECAGACAIGYAGLSCNESCPKGTYGLECKSTCNIGCIGGECRAKSGYCNCTAGHLGDRCDRSCPNGRFGDGCLQECGKCRGGAPCNKSSGFCDKGCAVGYISDFCDPCINSTWGRDCKSQCNCFKNYQCNVSNGDCGDNGCALYWVGNPCDTYEPCATGYYGKACIPCGNCDETCNIRSKCHIRCRQSSGVCLQCHKTSDVCTPTSACRPHFTGERCNLCSDTYYGRKCQHTCGRCALGKICDRVKGFCEACEQGYMGMTCNAECAADSFGHECEESCSDKCINKECDFRNGRCIYGCVDGWSGKSCSAPVTCNSQHYGPKCDIPCPNCLNSICRKVDGVCEYGCIDGYFGDRCDSTCRSGSYGENCLKTCGSCHQSAVCDIKTGECLDGCSGYFEPPLCVVCPKTNYGHECTGQCGHCRGSKDCDDITGVCADGCADGFVGYTCDSRKDQTYYDDPLVL